MSTLTHAGWTIEVASTRSAAGWRPSVTVSKGSGVPRELVVPGEFTFGSEDASDTAGTSLAIRYIDAQPGS